MRFRCILIAVLVICAAGLSQAAGRRAVSLRVLQSTVKAGNSEQAMRMCGITKLSGYVLDPRTHDIILFGDVDATQPPLMFDDFVVALRNAWYVYTERRGNVRYWSAPGCSIDPNPETLRELNAVNGKLSSAGSAEEHKSALLEWNMVGRKPQKVRVMGTPFDSHFAKVMVDADFYMKRLANGTVTLEIDGFQSMTDMLTEEARKAMAARESISTGNLLNRFWFCPGETTFSDDGGAVVLRTCPVKLLTEQQFLTRSGIEGYGRPNAVALRFADGFTAHYEEIGEVRPIYRQLAGLFRLAGIARLLKDENAAGMSGFDMRYLLYGHLVSVVPVSRAVTGLAQVREITEDRRVGEEITKLTYWHMSCGGVSMDVRPKRVSSKPKLQQTPPREQPVQPQVMHEPTVAAKTAPAVKKVTSAKTSVAKKSAPKAQAKAPAGGSVKKAVLSARKSSSSLYWDVPEGL